MTLVSALTWPRGACVFRLVSSQAKGLLMLLAAARGHSAPQVRSRAFGCMRGLRGAETIERTCARHARRACMRLEPQTGRQMVVVLGKPGGSNLQPGALPQAQGAIQRRVVERMIPYTLFGLGLRPVQSALGKPLALPLELRSRRVRLLPREQSDVADRLGQLFSTSLRSGACACPSLAPLPQLSAIP